MPHRRIIDLYERHAADWDRERGRDLFERPWLDRFADAMRPGGTLLDIGCGTGRPLAEYFIGQGFRISGIDSSLSLIALANARFPTQDWRVADMRALDLDRCFDGILAWHSFFHLSPADQRPMFARFAALAAPGAPLLFTSGPTHGESIGTWHGESLYHGSLDPDEYRALLDRHGFDVIENVIDDPRTDNATVWLARRRDPT